jgi:flagellar FliJ protein
MQKFKFKLDALLKVREFKEKKVKIELAEILKEITDVEDKITKINVSVAEAYEAQEKFIADAAAGRMIQFFPMFIQGKKEDLKNKESLLWALKKKYAAKIEELGRARGEVKILENFKDKQQTEHRKKATKKEQDEIEENFIMKANGLNFLG